MAEIQKDEYQFPDEIEETKGKPVDTLEEGSIDVDIEIVDDTPPADRNHNPIPENLKEELETLDASKEYSKNVKDKFTQYKKAWHDERRAKEAALREQQEAIIAAQRILEENKKLNDKRIVSKSTKSFKELTNKEHISNIKVSQI
jgi:hypothetical protein